MSLCYIALGGNVGDVVSTMDRGLDLLDEADGVTVRDVSHVYQTEPVGPSAGDAFLNAAALLDCDLDPLQLLRLLKWVEDAVGRDRESRWSPRPLDLDLLLIGDTVVRESPLTIPHPHLWYRRFVLDPLIDLATDVVHPLFGESIHELQEHVRQRPLPISLVGGESEARVVLARQLVDQFDDISIWDASIAGGEFDSVQITLELTEDGPTLAASRELSSSARATNRHCQTARRVRLTDLPGTPVEAAISVLTAALDEPERHSRPLRRMP